MDRLDPNLRGVIINEKTHPLADHIKTSKEYNLLLRKQAVENAVSTWQKYKARDEGEAELCQWSLNYFNVELSLINKALEKFLNEKSDE